MFVRLLTDLPIDPRCGATEDRVFRCIRHDGADSGRGKMAFFIGDNGEECGAFLAHEAELYDTREAAKAALEEDQ